MKTETATFAMGCFWSPQTIFSKIKGVTKTTVGYTGGHTKNPTYKQVCSGQTGHAEAIQITFDPKKIPYEKLLKAFWENHDPTQLNRQGPDLGTQYRSAIFYHSEKQLSSALKSKKVLQKTLKDKIQTEILPAQEFYPAEEYHQDYLEKQGRATCRI